MNKNYLIILSFLSVLGSNAQDIQLTQFYANPLYLNPAFTGASGCTRVSISHRNQWSGVSKGYKTSFASFDHAIVSKNIGVGIIAINDEAGTGSLKTTMIAPSIAYQLNLNRFNSIRFGLQPGICMKKVNFDKLLFGDQLNRSEKAGKDVSTLETPTQTKTYVDINAGMLLNVQRSWIGVSVSHINQPNESFYYDPKATVPIKYSIHIGTKTTINKEEKNLIRQKFITPIIHYKHQEKFDQLDIGFYYTQSILNFGLWYRGIPIFKAYKPGYSNNDAVSLILGFSNDNFNIGYSYDITISKLSPNTRGSHEITLAYKHCPPNKKKANSRIVHCPKF
jgi:type IX secretion system PorP/SprF family membrane protein